MASSPRPRPWDTSLSARRAWIEINIQQNASGPGVVALRKESVDRNIFSCINKKKWPVALRKESVDRNDSKEVCSGVLSSVALRKESVDRNVWRVVCLPCTIVALRKESVDRNTNILYSREGFTVALRKESVDRNSTAFCRAIPLNCRSPQGERG